MEGFAMLRQLIGQVQELLDLYGSPPPVPPHFLHLQPRSLLFQLPLYDELERRCYFHEDGTTEDDCYDFIRLPGRPITCNMFQPGKPPPSKRLRSDRKFLRNLSGTTCSLTETDMKHLIWKELPEDLREAVMARLPIPTLFRFRAVCKRWNSLPTTPSFSLLCTQSPQTQPWFYTISHETIKNMAFYDPVTNTGSTYDPVSNKWLHPPLPSLLEDKVVIPVASAGGLVCLMDTRLSSFYVCNPLTRSFRELPLRSYKVWSRIAVVSMISNLPKSTYQILWVGCNGEYEVYDSEKASWTLQGSVPSDIVALPLSLNVRSHAVTVESLIYFLRTEPDGILLYDLNTGIWKQHIIPSPRDLSDRALAEGGGGTVVLVGLVSKNAATCVCVWELQRMTLLWKEVDRMPNEWCLEFYGKHVKMSCLGSSRGGLLMLSLRFRRQINQLVTYDVCKRQWGRVPVCFFPRRRKKQWIVCGTSFSPSLTAVP